MEAYKILKYPDKRLFQTSKVVNSSEFKTSELNEIVSRMFLTMKINDGIGLAAPQVDIHKRIIVMEVEQKRFVLINPSIIYKSEEKTSLVEGCLSIPMVSGSVERPRDIEVEYFDVNGVHYQLKCTGLLSKCVQHEIDHLNGVLYVNRIEGLKQRILLKKYEKINKWV